MKTLIATGWTLMFLVAYAHPAFANAGPSIDPMTFVPAWLMILLAILAWRCTVWTALRCLFMTLGLSIPVLIALVFVVPFISPAFGANYATTARLIAVVFGGITVCRAALLIRMGWRARGKEAGSPDPAAAERLPLLPIGALLLLVTLPLTGIMIAHSVNPPISPSRLYRRATIDAKTAVTQAIVYANDKDIYPTSLQVLRNTGYANVLDKDPWGRDWVLSPVLTEGSKPRQDDDIYIYSKGPKGTGTYPRPFTERTGEGGSIGYSSIYGAWRAE